MLSCDSKGDIWLVVSYTLWDPLIVMWLMVVSHVTQGRNLIGHVTIIIYYRKSANGACGHCGSRLLYWSLGLWVTNWVQQKTNLAPVLYSGRKRQRCVYPAQELPQGGRVTNKHFISLLHLFFLGSYFTHWVPCNTQRDTYIMLPRQHYLEERYEQHSYTGCQGNKLVIPL